MKYQQTRKCDECRELRLCLYESSGPFRGSWLCSECNNEYEEALADITKAAINRLKNAPKEDNK